jgi:hypothetical protein
LEVTVMDLTGQIKERQRGSESVKLSLGSYASGYYLLRIKTDHEIITKKIIRK